MDTYNLVYVDDDPDSEIQKYFDKYFHSDSYEIVCQEKIFDPEKGYESLLEDKDITGANILLLDSHLFKNRTAQKKFTGEELMLVLKKFYPFIEIIIISQDEEEGDNYKISKYDREDGKSGVEYYSKIFPSLIDKAVSHLRLDQKLADKLKNNVVWDSVLIDKVINSLKGENVYDELTKTDIDNVIKAFKQIQNKLDSWGVNNDWRL